MNRISELRKETNTSQTELAKLLGVTRQAISLYEKWPDKGGREPKLETWQKLADYFKVSVPYLQGLSDIKDKTLFTFEDLSAFLNSPEYKKIMSVDNDQDLLKDINNSQSNLSVHLDENIFSIEDKDALKNAVLSLNELALSLNSPDFIKSDRDLDRFKTLLNAIKASKEIIIDNNGKQNNITKSLEYFLEQISSLQNKSDD
ncbi:helix-turn-helix transcriptional regulator [Leuconostoc kimchii]|uniref:XRE family transcriptional regulator n=1 Tax=Leuconostoc kimchii TaxID=136609 RepID=A0ABX5SK65_9LACO|nr:helix-turn-helix transcriptional regulator [Leuconostoc kimchii]QBR47764.1 XRE family transcriptional regulator [Leuconostoc kimchii]